MKLLQGIHLIGESSPQYNVEMHEMMKAAMCWQTNPPKNPPKAVICHLLISMAV